MNIHSDIHSVFKVFRAFRLGQVVLQLLQGSKTPLETFSGGAAIFIRPPLLCAFDTIHRLLCNRRRIWSTFSTSDKSIGIISDCKRTRYKL